MASGNNRTGYGNWEFDKADVNLDYCDVGLGLKIPWHQQQQQPQQPQQQQRQQQQQQQQQQSAVPWLQTRQTQNHSENNSRSPSPTLSGFLHRFGDGGGRITFTANQRQELERQTIIYKYMMASMPVPPELLIPLSKYPTSTIINSSSSSVGRKTGVELRYTAAGRGGGDPEPWRCRRTDGKKWRCSRDVAPEQKYCERHSHKGRPSRSRKPVESASPSPLSTLPVVTNLTTPSVSSSCNPILFSPYSIPKPSSHSFDLPSPPPLPQFNPFPRYPDWFTKKEVAPTAVTATACLYPQQIGGGGGETARTHAVEDHHQSCLLPRPFIDAWSLGDHVDPKDATNPIDNTSKCPTPSSPLNSILPLTLSMSAGIDHDHRHHDSEDNTKDHPEVRSSSSSHHHQQPLNWMNSWIGSPPAPGGPLAEALCLGISGGGNGIMSSHSDELVSPHGHSTSSSTTTLG